MLLFHFPLEPGAIKRKLVSKVQPISGGTREEKQPAMNIDISQPDAVRAATSPTQPTNFTELSRRHPEKIRVYSKGDSWFAYPRKYILAGADSNIIEWLGEREDLLILDGSHNGDEAESMLAGDKKLDLLKHLNEHEFDVLLFSGGGNDIVGRFDFDFFLNEWQPGMKVEDCIIRPRLERRLERIRTAVCDLIDLVQVFSRNHDLRIVTHTYDWAIPDPRGASFFGGLLKVDDGRSWMWPFFLAKGYYGPDVNHPVPNPVCREVVRQLLSELAAMQKSIAALPGCSDIYFVVDTQGTLQDDQWLNEIHPTPAGFKLIADRIYREGIRVACGFEEAAEATAK